MSKGHHSTVNTVEHMTHDVDTMSKEELEDTYGIKIDENGLVLDLAYNKTFKDVYEWVQFEAEQDEFEQQQEDDRYDHW